MVFREIISQFVFVNRPITQRLDRVIGNFNLTLSRWKVIDFIERSGSCTLVQISRHFSIKKPSVTRTINLLEEKQYVEQTPGRDKREKRIKLTALGKKVHMKCRDTLDRIERDLLKGVSVKEQKALLRLLAIIRDNLKRDGSLNG
jgi:MarR family transcriptional regulator, transcriptional regulator for hemolysin